MVIWSDFKCDQVFRAVLKLVRVLRYLQTCAKFSSSQRVPTSLGKNRLFECEESEILSFWREEEEIESNIRGSLFLEVIHGSQVRKRGALRNYHGIESTTRVSSAKQRGIFPVLNVKGTIRGESWFDFENEKFRGRKSVACTQRSP